MRTTDGIVSAVTSDSKTSVLLASRGQATSLTVLVDGVGDPVDARVVANSDMSGVDEDDFVVFIGGILVDPVRVQHTHVGSDATRALLGNTAQVAGEFELVDTLVLGLAVNDALEKRSLATTTTNGNTVHDETLLGLVTKLVGLVSARGAVKANDLLVLAVLPSSVK